MSELLTLARMARRLGVSQQWLRDQADAGKVPCLRAGNRYLFNAVAVQESIANQAASTRQGPAVVQQELDVNDTSCHEHLAR